MARRIDSITHVLEAPDREHLGGWAAILAELDGDNTGVDENVKIEAFAPIEEEEPIGPVDASSLAGAGDEGRRGGGWGEANSATLKANLRTRVPVAGDGIASGEGTGQRALDEIDRVDWVGRVEERSCKESNSLLDGLGENGRHGEWVAGYYLCVRKKAIMMVALRIICCGYSQSVLISNGQGSMEDGEWRTMEEGGRTGVGTIANGEKLTA